MEFLREWIIFGLMVLFVIFGWAMGAGKGPFKKKDDDEGGGGRGGDGGGGRGPSDDQVVERARAEGHSAGNYNLGGGQW